MTDKGYKNIFKTTFLFGFVRVFQILTGIIKNKVVALLLGPEGVGIIGILSNSINLLQSGAGLGISQSAVRDISEANGSNNYSRFSHIISLTNKVILFTCVLGIVVTIILSPFLSKWTFGDNTYTIAYIWLALVVGLNILTEGQLAILKGMRQMRALAKASMIGSIVGLITAVPMYFFFGKSGIVPSLIITAISAVFFSNYFVRKIKYEKAAFTFKQIKKESSPMVKMGTALMLVDFLSLFFDLIIVSYIRMKNGVELVGIYRAGVTIISSYFGIVLTSMITDYYPRISSINKDNAGISLELNKQTEVGLILMFPLVILFILFSPLLIELLYSKMFVNTLYYTDFAIFGILIILYSNNLGMILLAKQDTKVFTIYSIVHRLIFLPIYILLFNFYGLIGLGIAYILNALIQFISYVLINKFRYGIHCSNKTILKLLFVLICGIFVIVIRNIDNIYIRYIIGGLLLIYSIYYSIFSIKKMMNIDIISYLKSKINGK